MNTAIIEAYRNQFMNSSFPVTDGEEIIVESAIKGDASAFGILYDRYQPKIFRFVFLKVSRREEAEDITHQVFLSAWQNIRTYRARGFPFGSYLYKIARNEVIDFYRTNKSTLSLEEADPELFVGLASVEFAANTNMEIARVQNALRKLKPEYQDVIIMRFVEELAVKEVAATLGKSEGAVKLMQHRAIKTLRNILETA